MQIDNRNKTDKIFPQVRLKQSTVDQLVQIQNKLKERHGLRISLGELTDIAIKRRKLTYEDVLEEMRKNFGI